MWQWKKKTNTNRQTNAKKNEKTNPHPGTTTTAKHTKASTLYKFWALSVISTLRHSRLHLIVFSRCCLGSLGQSAHQSAKPQKRDSTAIIILVGQISLWTGDRWQAFSKLGGRRRGGQKATEANKWNARRQTHRTTIAKKSLDNRSHGAIWKLRKQLDQPALRSRSVFFGLAKHRTITSANIATTRPRQATTAKA